MAVSVQGCPVLRGDRDVHLLPCSGCSVFIEYPRNRPLSLWTARSPGRPGGGHPASYLCYQYQPANNTRERTTWKCYNLTGSDGRFTLESMSSWSVAAQAVRHGLLLNFFPLAGLVVRRILTTAQHATVKVLEVV